MAKLGHASLMPILRLPTAVWGHAQLTALLPNISLLDICPKAMAYITSPGIRREVEEEFDLSNIGCGLIVAVQVAKKRPPRLTSHESLPAELVAESEAGD